MQIQNSYWAGFFDGEGSVSISNGLRPHISITQKRTEILFEVQKAFGGVVDDKGMGCSHWRLTKTEPIVFFLESIFPYVFVKHDEIELLLEFCKLIRTKNRGCNPMSSDEKNTRWGYRKRLQIIRPNSNYIDGPSSSEKAREQIRIAQNYKCFDCGKNLKENIFGAIINKDKRLRCRKCSALEFAPNKRSRKNVSKEQIESVLKNHNTYEACSILGLSRATLYHKRKMFGLAMGKRKRERWEIEAAIKSAKTMQDAADLLGIDKSTLYDKIKKFGIKYEKKPLEYERKHITKEQIIMALNTSETVAGAAKLLQVTRKTLFQKRKQFNLIGPSQEAKAECKSP